MEFRRVVQKYFWGHSGPVLAVFTRVPSRDTRFPDFGPFHRGLYCKIALFSIKGGSGGEMEFRRVVQKYSWRHG